MSRFAALLAAVVLLCAVTPPSHADEALTHTAVLSPIEGASYVASGGTATVFFSSSHEFEVWTYVPYSDPLCAWTIRNGWESGNAGYESSGAYLYADDLGYIDYTRVTSAFAGVGLGSHTSSAGTYFWDYGVDPAVFHSSGDGPIHFPVRQ